MGAAESTTRGESEAGTQVDFDSLDFYEILGISEDATKEEIKRARRQMALQHHPDKNPGDPLGANKRFGKIQEAFETLVDDAKRTNYNYTRKKTPPTTASTPAPPPPSYGPGSGNVPGAFKSTEGEPPTESWFEWFFRLSGRDAKSKFDYETYSSCKSPEPGISSRDIAEFVNAIGSLRWHSNDGTRNAFEIFRNLFDCLGHDEWLLSGVHCPSFGCAHSLWTRAGWDAQELQEINAHGPEVNEFYNFWTKFETRKSFEWIQKYRYDPWELDARSLRYVRKENKLVQERFRREYNQIVRRIAQSLLESDPRYGLHVYLQAQRGPKQTPPRQNNKRNQKKKDKKRRRK